jgi:non-ribosomal peptide synthetase-like protein
MERARQPEHLLHNLFEARAEAAPANPAALCGGQALSYAELEKRANQLARFLRSKQIDKGCIVGLLLPRSPDVYVALLGILKSGAAYVPLDPDYPPERIEWILNDCHAQAVVTVSALAQKCGGYTGEVLAVELLAAEIREHPAVRLPPSETEVTGRDLCYIIYTSGTTGRPKGVLIEHRSACNLVRAEGELFNVQPSDRVYQGFSIAFDASVEEVWLAFHAGAALVVGTPKMMQAGAGLSRLLADAGVTVLSCVPTLLAMLEEDIPTVRLLILGGEECPQSLVARWCRPGRKMFNTYGPTEATVIATCGECSPGRRVTIGRPVRNYQVFILDEERKAVPAGMAGEICIGGAGLARGYVGRPELTAQKFVDFKSGMDGEPPVRVYRTGDLGRFTPDSEIEFLGRVDTQVKLRGYRVELTEIEAVLMESPAVLAAAVAVREDVPGVQQLAAYLVPRNNSDIHVEEVRKFLKSRLPAYMIPAFYERMPTLPTLPSGKVDRNALPAPRSRPAEVHSPDEAPRTELEKKIAAVWVSLFAPNPVSIQDHFFLDLGGHSLLAARMVSELRKDPAWCSLSMLDVYEHPTIESLAAKLEQAARIKTPDDPPRAKPATAAPKPASISRGMHASCGLLQLFGLYLVFGFFSLQWLAPYLAYTWMREDDYEILQSILGAVAMLVGLYPLMLAAAIVLKWTVIGRYKPGDYPLWSFYYFRFWFVNTIQSVIPVEYLSGTPLLNIYYRLMGAKIGSNVHLGTHNSAMFDLLSIGSDSSIGTDASLLGYTVENGLLRIGPIRIGERCFVGTRAVVREHAVLESDSALEDLSMLPRGARIPHGERWLGSPARPVAEEMSEAKGKAQKAGRLKKFAFALLHTLGLFLFPILVMAAIFPGIILMNYLNYEDDYYWYLTIAPIVGLSFVVLLSLEIVIIKWLLLGKVKPGRYPLHSFFYLRKWFVDQTMELSLDVLGPLYASIYLAPWYRALGARLGRRAEISTASFISPDLLLIDDESFIADSVSLGAARVENGFFTIAATCIGKRSFIGNSALLPPGTTVGDNALIGCLSVPPSRPEDALKEGASWMGSPAFFLPQRQPSTAFGAEQTFRPSQKLRLQRAIIELIRVILPSTGFIILTSLLFSVIVLIQDSIDLPQMLLLFPILYAGCGLLAIAFVAAVKWLLVGKYKPGERPLWSTFVWRNELINALHEHLADMFVVEMLTGTPFVCWYFRLLGAKIGPRVYMETTDLTEFDLVQIGAEATLNADCTIQTHLFEDRVMKMSNIVIGPRCTVGSGALVLYDTEMEEGAALGDLSLLMKGEVLPAETRWEGVPARPK